jgi:hypothetical protein
MRLATLCPFDEAPSGRVVKGSAFPFVWAWTKRITIHEERSWRVSTPKGNDWSNDSVKHCVMRTRLTSEAERLAKVYRALRKGREDEGNAPGAGDFYYGEMEMRRHRWRLSPRTRGHLAVLATVGLRLTREPGSCCPRHDRNRIHRGSLRVRAQVA